VVALALRLMDLRRNLAPDARLFFRSLTLIGNKRGLSMVVVHLDQL